MLRELCKNINFMKVQQCKTLYPTIEDRVFWDSAAEKFGEILKENTKQLTATPLEPLTASLYLDFTKTGNRNRYEQVWFRRRKELWNKSLLECFYNNGKYISDIIDLTWMILEETTWTWPAHARSVESFDGLPDFERHSLDLGVVQTADILAFVYQVLGSKLDEVSKMVTSRIKRTIKKVVFQDFLTRDDYWWMGMLGPDRGLNNWCPWMSSYVLRCAHLFEDDLNIFRKIVLKTMYMLDAYLDKYPEDGACNEGASYWRMSVGCLIEGIEYLNLATNGGFQEAISSQKLKNMAESLISFHITQNRFVNFGDCAANIPTNVWSFYHYGKLLRSEKMCKFALDIYKECPGSEAVLNDARPSCVHRIIDLFRYHEELVQYMMNRSECDNVYYYPSLHYLAVKPDEKNDKFLAFKGCHNKQSHNHNDVGSFVVYKNGIGFLIDTGNMRYSRDTFNENRYTIWTNRSEYHNLPIINGHGQKNGIEYAATNVEYSKTDTAVSLSMNLKEAYENRDEIYKWIRKIEHSFDYNEFVVTEDFAFTDEFDYELCFMTPQNAAYVNEILTLKDANGAELQLVFEDADFDFKIDEIKLEDEILRSNWGDCLYRVRLCARGREGKIVYRIK